MHYKIKTTLFCLLMCSMQGFAQIWDMTPQPPDVTSFSRFGDYPVSYYTGAPQISIPLYTIKERDVEIPLTLAYSGTGIRVADESTWVGLGWNLSPGGYISRIVIGNQGDSHLSDVYNALLSRWQSGVEVDYVKRHPDYPTWYVFTGDDVEGVTGSGSLLGTPSSNDPYVDLPSFPVSSFSTWSSEAQFFQPNIYTFGFLGHSGKFFIDPETGEPVIMDKKENLLFEKDAANWDPEADGWKVTLPNGVVVYFQDHEKVQQTVTGCGAGAPSLTWKITKIQLVNNQEINFLYDDCGYETASISDIDAHSYEDDVDYNWNRFQDYNSFNLPDATIDCSVNRHPVGILNQLKVLRQIITPKYIVDFTRVANEAKPRLKAMEFYNKNNPDTKTGYKFNLEELKKAGQAWNQWGSSEGTISSFGDEPSFIKYKLTSLQKYVVENGVAKNYGNPYLFYYHEEIGLPSILSFAQDYWGYYNGKGENRGLIPDESQMYNNEGYFSAATLPTTTVDDLRARPNSNRGPSAEYMIQGTLNKIVYPTAGYTKFVFEPNKFYFSDDNISGYILTADEITFNNASGHYQRNYNGDGTEPSIGAGLRIKEILNYDSDDRFINRTKFDYMGSGVLLAPVHFWRIEHYLLSPDGTNIFYYKIWNASGSNYSQTFALPNLVGYSNVREIESNSETDNANEELNGVTQYHFYNYPSTYNPLTTKVSISYLDTRNGLPTSVEYKDNAGDPIKTVSHTYKKVGSSMFLSMAAKHINSHSNDLYNVFKIEYTPMKSDWWKEDYTTETENGVTKNTYYDYSSDGYANVTSKRMKAADGLELETRHKYPLDYNLTALTEQTSDPEYYALKEMAGKNMVQSPVEVIELKDGKIIGGKLNTYRLFHNTPQLYQTFSLEPTAPLDINPVADQSDNTLFDWSYTVTPNGANGPGYFIKDNFYNSRANATLKNYDEKGNLKEYSLSSGQKVSYLWGYNQTLPIAKVTNAALDEASENVNSTITIPTVQVPGLQSTYSTLQSDIAINAAQDVTLNCTVDRSGTDPGIPDYYFNVELSLYDQDAQSEAYTAQFGITTQTSAVVSLSAGTYTLRYKYTGDIGSQNTFSFDASMDYQIVSYHRNILCTSFEEDTQNTSPDAATGRKSHSGTYTFNLPQATGDYVLSYYFKQGTNDWQYHEEPINITTSSPSTMTIGQSGQLLDELRLYPSDAQMTTYTYDPLIGMTSQTDPNGKTSYFEYDDLGRLKQVKDHENNIVKHYDYNYKMAITP